MSSHTDTPNKLPHSLHGEPSNDTTDEGPNFKEQLDRKATESRSGNGEQKPNPIVEKVIEYVPAAAKVLGVQEETSKANKATIPGPPDRPHHDAHIEEFVRDQHRSKNEDGILE